MSDLERLVNWLESMEAESRLKASSWNGQADAFRSAAIKARFAALALDPKLNPQWIVGDDSPITPEKLKANGFMEVPSDMGSKYANHFEKDGFNIWEFNGLWLWNDGDRLKMRTMRELKFVADLLYEPNCHVETIDQKASE
jgi:hypothetical protein